MNFSREVVCMPPIPTLLGDIMAHMFNSAAMQIYAYEGSAVEAGKPFINVTFRKMLGSEKKIFSPTTGLVISSQDSRVGEDWCIILRSKGAKLQLDGKGIYQNFSKGFLPMKESVYRYAKRSLAFEERDVERAIEILLNSRASVRELNDTDIDKINELLNNPEHDIKNDESLRESLRDLIR